MNKEDFLEMLRSAWLEGDMVHFSYVTSLLYSSLDLTFISDVMSEFKEGISYES